MRSLDLTRSEPAFDPSDPDGYRAAMDRFGPRLGAEDSGASLYELPPGEALCPYHFEYGEEEWLLVLTGRATVRTPEGTHEAGPMTLVFFPKGAEGAHQVRNDSDAAVRVLLWSTIRFPSVTSYPDSGKVGVYPERDRADDVIVERAAGVGYYHGELPRDGRDGT